MSNPYRSPEFQKLFQEWNRKLTEDGLKDVEDFTLPYPALKCWHNLKWRRLKDGRFLHVQQYYELASSLIDSYPFRTEIHKLIWTLHCEGLPVRHISSQLGPRGHRLKKSMIHEIIQAIEIHSGLKRGRK